MFKLLSLIIFFTFLQIFFIYVYSRISFAIGLIDHPSERKIHKGIIPLVGGLSIYSSLLIFFIIFPTNLEHKVILFSSFFIFFIGLLDDRYNIGILERIFFQIIACLIVIGFNIKIIDIGSINDFKLHLGNLGILLSFLCIIGFTNSINFSDGLDGLASGYILNCLFSIIVFSFLNGYFNNLEPLFFLCFIIIIFIFSNVGFILPKTFLGDSGSTSLGFLLACYLVYFTLPSNRHFEPVLTLWTCPLPILDFFTVFISRLLNKTNPFKPDRIHLHYLIQKTKISRKFIPLLLVLCSFLLSGLGYLTFINLGELHSLILFILIFLFYYLISLYLKNFN